MGEHHAHEPEPDSWFLFWWTALPDDDPADHHHKAATSRKSTDPALEHPRTFTSPMGLRSYCTKSDKVWR
jgi:hypothetical protein